MPRCNNCGCPHCPAVRTIERDILTPRGRKRVVRRRRICRHCQNVFYTREEDEDAQEAQPGLQTQETAPQATEEGIPAPVVVPPQRSGRPGRKRGRQSVETPIVPPADNPFLSPS